MKILKEKLKQANGFSLIELIVVIAIMAILIVVIVPSLLSYNERSRANKDNAAMDEVVNAIQLSLTDQNIYDEVVQFSTTNNISCYVDSNDENNYNKIITKDGVDNVSQYTFASDARQADETPFYAAGNMRGVTITFAPNKSFSKSTFDLKQGVINQYVQIHGNYRFGALNKLYAQTSSVVGETIISSSQTYRNSEYTVFIVLGTSGGNDEESQNAVHVYGQWSGTNLPASEVSYQIVTNRNVDDSVSEIINDAEWNEINGSKLTFNPGDLNSGGSFDASTKTGNDELTSDDFKEDEKGIYAYLVNGDTLVLRNSPREDLADVTKVYGKLPNTHARNWANDASVIATVKIETPILPKSCSNWFSNATNLTKIQNIWDLCTDECTNLSYMFYNCSELTNINVSYWNTSNVLDMQNMFNSCTSLKNIYGLSNFDTSNVTNMYRMFAYCSSLTKIDVSNFDTSKVTSIRAMFDHCSSVTKLDVSGFDMSKVDNTRYMFSNCSNLIELDVSGFHMPNVKETTGMFSECDSLKKLDASRFNMSKVTDMGTIFGGCSSLENINGLSDLDTSSVTSFYRMFTGCSKLTEIDVQNFDTSKATTIHGMFDGCSSVKKLDVSHFDTSNVTVLRYMFSNCHSLTDLDVSGFDMSNVTDAKYMFYKCKDLVSIGDMSKINDWNVTNTDTTYMFGECSKLSTKPSWY